MTRFYSWKSTQMSRNSSDTQAKRKVSEPEMVVVCAGGSLFVCYRPVYLIFQNEIKKNSE